jgi:hypothetical protein
MPLFARLVCFRTQGHATTLLRADHPHEAFPPPVASFLLLLLSLVFYPLPAKASSSQAPLSLCGPKRRTRAQPGKHACTCTQHTRAKELRQTTRQSTQHATRHAQYSERAHCPRANAREHAANDQSTGWTNVAIGATHAEKAASASEKGVIPSLVRLGKPACRTTHREDGCQPFRRVHKDGCSSECAVTQFLFFARSRLLCGVGIVTRPLRRLRAAYASSLRGSLTPLRSRHASHRLRP